MQLVYGIGCLFFVGMMVLLIVLWRKACRLLAATPPRQYYETFRRREGYVPLKKIPPDVVKVFVCCEDPTFYEHCGILPDAMVRAVIYSIRKRRYFGGSTITQQLVKNVYLTHEQTVRRKALESIIALYIDWRGMLSKDEILELYLNLARMGPRSYGIGAAAEYHFGKSAERLTVNQAVILATILPSPFWNRPVEAPTYFERLRFRTLLILVSEKFMTPEEAKKILRRFTVETGFDPELKKRAVSKE